MKTDGDRYIRKQLRPSPYYIFRCAFSHLIRASSHFKFSTYYPYTSLEKRKGMIALIHWVSGFCAIFHSKTMKKGSIFIVPIQIMLPKARWKLGKQKRLSYKADRDFWVIVSYLICRAYEGPFFDLLLDVRSDSTFMPALPCARDSHIWTSR